MNKDQIHAALDKAAEEEIAHLYSVLCFGFADDKESELALHRFLSGLNIAMNALRRAKDAVA